MTPEALERIKALVEAGKKVDLNGCFVMSDLSEIGGTKDDVEIWIDMGLTVAVIDNGVDGKKIECAEFLTQAANTRADIAALLEAYEKLKQGLIDVAVSLDHAMHERNDGNLFVSGSEAMNIKNKCYELLGLGEKENDPHGKT